MGIEDDSNEKDERTTLLRERVLGLSIAEETHDAAACLTALSFASRTFPGRHVWIDTDLAGRTSLDLEDRSTEETWDNTVRRLKGLEHDRLIEIVKAWLSGEALSSIEE